MDSAEQPATGESHSSINSIQLGSPSVVPLLATHSRLTLITGTIFEYVVCGRVFLLGKFYCGKSTYHEIYSLNRFLSVGHNIVEYRYNVICQISESLDLIHLAYLKLYAH